MRRADKAIEIVSILNELYPNPDIPLNHTDPFTLLVATLLSAQCTDKRVNEVTVPLFSLAKNAVEMAQQTEASIYEIVKPCGLGQSKAKAIKELSQIIVQENQNCVPNTFEGLEALPGVGHKTASVVMAQAYNVPAFPVDTHIHRLATRWGLSNGSSVARTEADLKKVFPKDQWNKLHLQIIYFGREHCPARGHRPMACPICSWAMSKSRMTQEQHK